MIKETTVQKALKEAFPEFYNKSELINYYVGFDFPEKQMKMVGWWQRVIQFIIQHEGKVYIPYSELHSYLHIHNLKPTPLPAIINHLTTKQQLAPENQYEVRAAHKESAQKQKSFFGTMMGYFSKPAIRQVSFYKFQGGQKIFSKKIKQFKKQEMIKQLEGIFTEHCRSINQFKLTMELEHRVSLDKDSIFQLLRQLSQENVIQVMYHSQKPFVLFSHTPIDYQNKQWCEIEKMKYCLREEIDKFEFMIGREEEKIFSLKQKAREYITKGNKKSSLTLCKQAVEKEKKVGNIVTRKNLIENQLTQLEYNQMNKSTLALLQEAHNIYEQTMVDPNKLEQIAQKNMEMQVANKQTNQTLENMVSQDEELEEDVDQMMRALEKQMKRQPQKISVHVQVADKMDLEYIDGVKVNKEKRYEKMDIEKEKDERDLNIN